MADNVDSAVATPAKSAAVVSLDDAPARPVEKVKDGSSMGGMVANWAGEIIIVISGFVLPRLINDKMSQEELGIWDFGWSIRSYIELSCSSLGSSAGYYVARYRTSQQWAELNRTLGAMLGLVIYGALFASMLTIGAAVLTPALIKTSDFALISAGRSLVLTMGLASCIATPGLVYAGVLVGHRRFGLLNLIDGLCNVYVVFAVIGCVWFGAGLKMMGLCVLVRELLNFVGKFMAAHRIAPEIHVRPRWADTARFREIFGFSGKTLLDVLSKVLQYQVGVLFISSVVGPAAVALYSRPRSLILITTRFIMGFARVLVPQASALKEKQDRKGLAELLMRSTRYGLYLALPPALIMLMLGHQILRTWMGSGGYAETPVLMILVLGYLPLFAQQATYHVLLGLGAHGWSGVASMTGAVLGAILTYFLVVVFKMGITGAALGTAIPVAAVNLFVVPYAGCRAAQVSMMQYLRSSIIGPLLAVIPFAALLWLGQHLFTGSPRQTLFGTLLLAGPVLAIIYWFVAIPPYLKKTLLTRLRLGPMRPAVGRVG